MSSSLVYNPDQRLTRSWQGFFNQCAHWTGICLIFCVPLSTTLITLLTILYIISLFASGNIKYIFPFIKSPITISIIIYIGINLISLTYTNAPLYDALHAFKIASRLLIIPLLMPIFIHTEWQKKGLWALFFTIFISLLAGYIMSLYYGNYHFSSFFKDRIYTSSFAAFGIFLLLSMVFEKISLKKWHVLIIAWLILAGYYYLMFVNTGRTGQVISIILTILILYLQIKKRYQKIFFVGLILSLLSLPILLHYYPKHHFPQLRERVKLSMQERGIQIPPIYIRFVDAYRTSRLYFSEWHNKSQTLPPMANDSSMRLEFYFRTLKIGLERPFLGWGAGSFTTIYNSIYPERSSNGKKITNPHNQFLLTYVELGIPGLTSLLLILLTIGWHALSIKRTYISTLLLGIVFFMFFGCILNSWFLDFTSFHFFASIIALLAARTIYCRDKVMRFKKSKRNKISLVNNEIQKSLSNNYYPKTF